VPRRRDVREVGEPPRTETADLTHQPAFWALLELATVWPHLTDPARDAILNYARTYREEARDE